jgi:23S rRNA G2069 N7-methylase RlmK/C1962 C5-methylase RlmI
MTTSGGLLPIISEAATAAGRSVTLLGTYGPAMDHPVNPAYMESSYLTAHLVTVSN